LALLSVLCFHAASAAAQGFPTKPVRVIVPFAPGGATDVVFRLLAPKLSENLGQQAIVDNRPGGGSTIGMDIVARSAPDGYTIGVANLSFAVNPSLLPKLPYDTERDFAPVSLVTIVPLGISVHPSVPARSVKELIALAKAKPGALTYASSGNGSATHMATELFKNSVEIPGPATEALCQAAREAKVHVVMGLCEHRPGTFGTMYNTQLFIDDQGRILGKHQKLVPTVGERLVHTGGYG